MFLKAPAALRAEPLLLDEGGPPPQDVCGLSPDKVHQAQTLRNINEGN